MHVIRYYILVLLQLTITLDIKTMKMFFWILVSSLIK